MVVVDNSGLYGLEEEIDLLYIRYFINCKNMFMGT